MKIGRALPYQSTHEACSRRRRRRRRRAASSPSRRAGRRGGSGTASPPNSAAGDAPGCRRATGRPSTPEAPSARSRVGAEEEAVASASRPRALRAGERSRRCAARGRASSTAVKPSSPRPLPTTTASGPITSIRSTPCAVAQLAARRPSASETTVFAPSGLPRAGAVEQMVADEAVVELQLSPAGVGSGR